MNIHISKLSKDELIETLEKELEFKISEIHNSKEFSQDEKKVAIQTLKVEHKKKRKDLGFSLF
jgi:hypothetical protein